MKCIYMAFHLKSSCSRERCLQQEPGPWYFDFVLAPERFVTTALDAYRAGLQFLNEAGPS